jgi:hypothetical protein
MMDINEVTVAQWFSNLDAARVLIAVVNGEVIAIDLDTQPDLHPSAISWTDCTKVMADLNIDAADVSQCRLVTRIGPVRRR